jgi:hypothetical protein
MANIRKNLHVNTIPPRIQNYSGYSPFSENGTHKIQN